MASFQYTWEDEEGNRRVELEIAYTVEPYRPAVINADPDHCHPAEGGVQPDGAVDVLEVVQFDDDGDPLWVKSRKSGTLPDSLVAEVLITFDQVFPLDSLYELCCEDADRCPEPDYDMYREWAYERSLN